MIVLVSLLRVWGLLLAGAGALGLAVWIFVMVLIAMDWAGYWVGRERWPGAPGLPRFLLLGAFCFVTAAAGASLCSAVFP